MIVKGGKGAGLQKGRNQMLEKGGKEAGEQKDKIRQMKWMKEENEFSLLKQNAPQTKTFDPT